MMRFRTALCDLLGIEYPILQSGMGTVAGPDLVAEVSRAGGLGILAGLNVPADDLRLQRRVVGECHSDLLGVGDHVVVCDDETRGVDNKARAKRGRARRSGIAGRALLAEEIAEEVVERRAGDAGRSL